MNILAVDTAGKTLGVALMQDEHLLYECSLDAGHTHSETLMPLVDHCLRLCGMKCADIDLYAVNAGPGSFTGLRIGLAAVKGMAFAHNTPCAPVSTLEALAYAHSGEGTVVCALDARRAQVYSAAFDLATHQRLMEDGARAVKDLASFVQNCKKPVFFVGDGAALCYNEYSQIPGVLAFSQAGLIPYVGDVRNHPDFFGSAMAALEDLMSVPAARRSQSARMKMAIDGAGADRIAEALTAKTH